MDYFLVDNLPLNTADAVELARRRRALLPTKGTVGSLKNSYPTPTPLIAIKPLPLAQKIKRPITLAEVTTLTRRIYGNLNT